jgi:PKD repeat protein/uncharacterized protein YjdB
VTHETINLIQSTLIDNYNCSINYVPTPAENNNAFIYEHDRLQLLTDTCRNKMISAFTHVGARNGKFTISTGSAVSNDLKVNFKIDGSNYIVTLPSSDTCTFNSSNGTGCVTIPANQSSADITVTPTGSFNGTKNVVITISDSPTSSYINPSPAPSSSLTIQGYVLNSVTVTPSTATMTTGGNSLQLSAQPLDQYWGNFSGASVTWSSDNTSAATVNSTGLVASVAPGTAHITATAKFGSVTVTGQSTITVQSPNLPPPQINITPASPKVYVGDNQPQFTADVSGVTWSVFDKPIGSNASIDSDGTFHAGSVTGSVTIQASKTGYTPGSVTFSILSNYLNSVSVTPSTALMNVGDSPKQLTAHPLDQKGNAFTLASITWSSDNTSVATVNSTGLVTSVAQGTAHITATAASGFISETGQSTITVQSTITITPTGDIYAGNTRTFIAKDYIGNTISVTWSPSSQAGGSIDPSSGLFTASGVGAQTPVTIFAKKSGYADGQLTFNVIPNPLPPPQINITPASPTVYVGDSQPQFIARDPGGLSLSGVIWSITSEPNGSNALIDADGTFHAGVVPGSVTIQASKTGYTSGSLTFSILPNHLNSVTVTPSAATLNQNATQQLTAHPLDQKNNPFPWASITWSSADNTIASVDPNTGLVTANGTGKTGSVDIIATAVSGFITPPPGKSTITVNAAQAPALPVVSFDVGRHVDASQSTPKNGNFRINRTGPTDAPLTVYYLTGGTARSGDYVALPGSVTIQATQSYVDIPVVMPQSPTFSSGSRTLTLTITPSSSYTTGLPNADTITIFSGPVAGIASPVAAFTVDRDSGSSPLTVTFTDASTRLPYHWLWYIDGTVLFEDFTPYQTHSYKFTTTGSHSIQLCVQNSGGTNCANTNITVNDGGPKASFTAVPKSGTVPLSVTFTDTSTGVRDLSWDFGDGTTYPYHYYTVNAPKVSRVHTYTTTGTFGVKLWVSDISGRESVAYDSIDTTQALKNVVSIPSIVSFNATVPDDNVDTDNVQFSGTVNKNVTGCSVSETGSGSSIGTISLSAADSLGVKTLTFSANDTIPLDESGKGSKNYTLYCTGDIIFSDGSKVSTSVTAQTTGTRGMIADFTADATPKQIVVTFVADKQTTSSKSTIQLSNVSNPNRLPIIQGSSLSGYSALFEVSAPSGIRSGNGRIISNITKNLNATSQSSLTLTFPGQVRAGTYKFGITVSVCPSSGCTVTNRIVKTIPMTVKVQVVQPKPRE